MTQSTNVAARTQAGAAVESGTRVNPLQMWLGRIGFWILILIILFFLMFPFYWAINTSLMTESELFSPARIWPNNPTTINYDSAFNNDSFLRGLRNSAIVSTVSVLLALVVGSFAAYALGRIKFKGRMLMLYAVLAMTMFPQISILSGLFSIVRDLGVYGGLSSLVLTYPLLTLPFTVWVLTSFFEGLPAELEQAALVDGATSFQTFYRILLPLTAPALVTTGLLAFIVAWNEFLFALTFTLSNTQRTVPVAIALITGGSEHELPWGNIMAASVTVTVPLILLVLMFQRRLVAGLTAGAVKG